MGIQIDLNFDQIYEGEKIFKQLKKIITPTATRQALNKTLTKTKTRTNRLIREKFKLKSRDVNQRIVKLRRAKGNSLKNMNASFQIRNTPVSMRLFMKGSKAPPRPNFGGIAPKKRKNKRLRFEITPGKTTYLQGTFYARGNSGNPQVFSRHPRKKMQKGKGQALIKRALPGIGKHLEKNPARNALERFMARTLADEFNQAYKFNVNKLINRKGSRRG